MTELAQVSVIPTQSQKPLRNTGRTHFKPGNRMNPGGRPKGIAALVREITKDGAQTVTILHAIATGKMPVKREYVTKNGIEIVEELPSHRDRIAAIEILLERGFGKTPEVVANFNAETDIETLAKALAKLDIEREPKPA